MALTLTNTIDATQREFAVTGTVTIEPGYRFRLGDELLELQGFVQPRNTVHVLRNLWYVRRGLDLSTAATHANGTAVLGATDAFVSAISGTTPPDPFADGGPGSTPDLDAVLAESGGQDIADALTGAAAPDSGNPFATIADAGGTFSGDASDVPLASEVAGASDVQAALEGLAARTSTRGYFEVVSGTYTYDQFVGTKGPIITTLAVGDKILTSSYRQLVAFDDSNASSLYPYPSDVDGYNYLGLDPTPVLGLDTVTHGDHNTVGLLDPTGPNANPLPFQWTAAYGFMEPDTAPLDVYAYLGGDVVAGDGTQGTVRLDLWVWRSAP